MNARQREAGSVSMKEAETTVLWLVAVALTVFIGIISSSSWMSFLPWLVPVCLIVLIGYRLWVVGTGYSQVIKDLRDDVLETERKRFEAVAQRNQAEAFIVEFKLPAGEVRRVLDEAGAAVRRELTRKHDILARGMTPIGQTLEMIKVAEHQLWDELRYQDGQILEAERRLEKLHRLTMGYSGEQCSDWRDHIGLAGEEPMAPPQPFTGPGMGEPPQHID
jgi:hypothetical protein